jgi:hypothetical protein
MRGLYNFISNTQNPIIHTELKPNNFFNKNMNYYVCSSGGCGSTILYNYLSNFGNVYHIHDRYPPNKLAYVGKENTTEDIYREWFNNVIIPEDKLDNYKVLFIYRNPLQVIYSRFAQRHGPNMNHLKNIKCMNNGNINIFDVLKTGMDLYKMEEFFDNYVSNKERNYDMYCVKYEMFWDNIAMFNKIVGIPDIKQFYPEKKERLKQIQFQMRLNKIYSSLITKMNSMRFIEFIPKKTNEMDETDEVEI